MDLPKRKPTRLKNYDYSQNGYYFVTICTKNKAKIFGNIVGEGFPLPQLTEQGKIVEKYIDNVPEIKKHVIMPNYIHIVFSINNDGRGDPSPTIVNAVGLNIILQNKSTKIITKFETFSTPTL